jgi:hypothetical protein
MIIAQGWVDQRTMFTTDAVVAITGSGYGSTNAMWLKAVSNTERARPCLPTRAKSVGEQMKREQAEHKRGGEHGLPGFLQ